MDHPYRSKIIALFNETVDMKVAQRLEIGVFEVTYEMCKDIHKSFTNPVFRDRYSAEAYKLSSNLPVIEIPDDPNAQYDLARKTSSELNPAASESIRTEIDKRRGVEIEKTKDESECCPKCSERDVDSIIYQASAGDEASTKSIKCLKCGYGWRKRV